ncbi:MAG TPA: Gfo/Idh/MocA family oxidoreductase [Myxococcota bacterium]|nr:Gfo/Idh/MocA family oxidoreductase [Myxococcota bacterium]HOC99344.1 Gfo/Idh/MocA family oxidoreductase [Myxococcota bacterium]HOH75651.1 Gfo/Idh/MocA family oxidoreductase [Myxococcota bacterium]HPV03853.1 Gfo/Idh/MocA family oxidoreductase [Myxococcota bacterium]
MKDIINVGLIGSGMISQVHFNALQTVPGAKVVAVADLNQERARDFAASRGITKVFRTHAELLADQEIDAVVVAIPNYLHAPVSIDALEAGKHVICEKPLALTLEDAERMIATARRKGLVLAHAEELCFIPKFVRAQELAASGGIGKPYLLRQCEKHDGPYSPWFWKPAEAGGGIVMDMGCHAIECIRFFLGKKKVKSVMAHMGTYLHGATTQEEDHCIIIMEFEDGTVGQAEASWALRGGMDSTFEIFGTDGVVYADLLKGSALRAFSREGFPGSDGPSNGWTFHDYEWLWNNGYPQEDAHFVECMLEGKTPVESGEDGLAVLEIILAAYHSAGIGRKVNLPFRPKGIPYPVDLWLNPRPELGAGPVSEL